MIAFMTRRLLLGVMTIWLISILSFIIIQLPPGDFVDAYIAQLSSSGSQVSAAEAENLRQLYGLGEPFYVQYGKWLARIVTGDFGESMEWRRPVTEVIGDRIWLTLLLSFAALLVTLLELDERERCVVEDDDRHVELPAIEHFEFGQRHAEPAIADEADDLALREGGGSADGGGQRESHGGKAIRDEDRAWVLDLPERHCDEHVGAGVDGDKGCLEMLAGDRDEVLRTKPGRGRETVEHPSEIGARVSVRPCVVR